MLEQFIDNLAKNKEIYFRVKAVPGAGTTGFLDKMADGTIKIALAAAPEKGRANQELINFLAAGLGVRRYQVKIIGGANSRLKLIKVSR
ncbi:MAG: DUF167 domain-containing protein [Patescibacteria group bacterium]